MADTTRPTAIVAADTPPRARATGYPADLAARVAGRDKRPLGDRFGLSTFGVNLTRLAPGAWSALHHRHGRQDEFIYVLEGTAHAAHRRRGDHAGAWHVRRLSGRRHAAPPGKPRHD